MRVGDLRGGLDFKAHRGGLGALRTSYRYIFFAWQASWRPSWQSSARPLAPFATLCRLSPEGRHLRVFAEESTLTPRGMGRK